MDAGSVDTFKDSKPSYVSHVIQNVSNCAHLCFVGLETSSNLRQASSNCAKVFGGGRGGIAGSWINGWPGWCPRR